MVLLLDLKDVMQLRLLNNEYLTPISCDYDLFALVPGVGGDSPALGEFLDVLEGLESVLLYLEQPEGAAPADAYEMAVGGAYAELVDVSEGEATLSQRLALEGVHKQQLVVGLAQKGTLNTTSPTMNFGSEGANLIISILPLLSPSPNTFIVIGSSPPRKLYIRIRWVDPSLGW